MLLRFFVFSQDCVKNVHISSVERECLKLAGSYVKKNRLPCIIRELLGVDRTGQGCIHENLRVIGGIYLLREFQLC